VNDFVEQCRQEWRRLRVPASVANEMAAELEADLAEAASEGVSAEDLLGQDPRSFAASWAAARDIGPRPPARRAILFAAGAVFVAFAITGAALALFAGPGHALRAGGPTTLAVQPMPLPAAVAAEHAAAAARAATAGVTWLSAAPEPVPASGGDTRTIGEVLLIVGLAGTAGLVLLSLWRRSAAL
jgi:hypothetical protein